MDLLRVKRSGGELHVQRCGIHCGDDELLTNVRYVTRMT